MNLPIRQILEGTPVWVWILMAFLVVRSARRLRPAARSTRQVLIVPLLFIAWGLFGLFVRQGSFSDLLLDWLIGGGTGFALGFGFKVNMQVDGERDLALFPGSVVPLVRVVVIFGTAYVLNVAAVLHPGQRSTYMALDTFVSGASAGYFIGWMLRFFQSYRNAPRVSLEAWAGGAS